MHAYAKKCYSSIKKITQFKFSSFQENILCKEIDITYLKENGKLNNRFLK